MRTQMIMLLQIGYACYVQLLEAKWHNPRVLFALLCHHSLVTNMRRVVGEYPFPLIFEERYITRLGLPLVSMLACEMVDVIL
jgi:hypothetical protein